MALLWWWCSKIALLLGRIAVKMVWLSSWWWRCTRVGGGASDSHAFSWKGSDSDTEHVTVGMGRRQDGIVVKMVQLSSQWRRWIGAGGDNEVEKKVTGSPIQPLVLEVWRWFKSCPAQRCEPANGPTGRTGRSSSVFKTMEHYQGF